MLRTPYGQRVLEGAQARVFAKVLLDLLNTESLNQFRTYHLGIDCFDNLTYSQKISVLSTIGNGLLRKYNPPVDLTGVLEGAVAAVFEHLNNLIAIEIDKPHLDTDWREMVVATLKQIRVENIPAPTCNDLEEWIIEVESIVEDILKDMDYDNPPIVDLYVDNPSEKSKYLKTTDGLLDNYYSTTAEGLTKEKVEEKLDDLRNLCRLVI
jgi:hypothetical protein